VAGLAPGDRTFAPDAAWVGLYDAHYRGVYRAAYARLRPLHRAAAALQAEAGPQGTAARSRRTR
jgi:hypothetical protein